MANKKPVCKLKTTQFAGTVGELFIVDASASTDVDGAVARLKIDSPLGELTWHGLVITLPALPAGKHAMTVKVCDDRGLWSSGTEIIATVSAPIEPPVEPPVEPTGTFPPIVVVVDAGQLPTPSKAVLTEKNFEYIGDILVPQAPAGKEGGFFYTEGAMTGRRFGTGPRDVQLFLAGTTSGVQGNNDEIYLLDCPAPSLTAPPEARVIRALGDVTQGKRDGQARGKGDFYRLFGLLWVEETRELFTDYVTSYEGYSHNPNFGRTTVNLETGALEAVGPYRGNFHSGMIGTMVLAIPPAFRDRYGITERYAIGAGGIRHGVQSVPWGASLMAFDPPSRTHAPDIGLGMGSNPARTVSFDARPFVMYDEMHRMKRPNDHCQVCRYTISGPYDCEKGYFTLPRASVFGGVSQETPYTALVDNCTSAAWIETPTHHGVVFFGNLVDKLNESDEIPHNWYSDKPKCCHGYGAQNWAGTNGPCASSVVGWWWIFDPHEFARAYRGQIAPWQVQYASAFRAKTIGNYSDASPTLHDHGGHFYDAQEQVLYVCQKGTDYRNPYATNPRIRAFKVKS
jgi:hypothetical protein